MRNRRTVPLLLGAAAAMAAAVPLIGLGAPTGAVLPDLVADAPEFPVFANHTYADGTQALLLRFDGFVHNIGPGPLEVRGSDRVGSRYTTVRQYVRTPTGMVANAPLPAGPPEVVYETADGHNHFHLMRIARYSLWNQARTAEVAAAQKVGFCLEDSQRRETTGPAQSVYINSDFCHQNNPTAAAITMGVSAGWRDRYGANLALQWVDVSDVRPGTYWLAAEIDTDGVIEEADETNNTRRFAASASTVPGYVDVPGTGAAAITLAAAQFGTPGARRFRITALPAKGVLRSGTTVLAAGAVVTSADLTYTPGAGQTGPDEFGYVAFDSTSQFPRTPAPAAVTLNIGQAPAQASVAISGAPASLDIGTSAQLTATVTNTTGGVAWSVNGVAGGNATVGTISASGLYAAPAAVPAGGQVVIRATSQSTPAAFDEKTVRITDPGAPNPAPDPGVNLVRNASFESDAAGWTTWQAAVTREQRSDAPDGVWVARVARTSGTSFTLDDAPTTLLGAQGGTTYTGAAFVKAANTVSVGGTVRVYLRERTASGATVRTVTGPAVTLTGAFQRVQGQIQPAGGNQVEIYLGYGGAVTGSAFHVDRISLGNGQGTSTNAPPVASFTVAPAAPVAGQQVTFTDTSTDDGRIASRAWDLDGDGQFDDSTAAAPTATYPAAGPVTVGLRVTDNLGVSAQTTRNVTVAAPPAANTPPSASFTVSPSGPVAGQVVTFTDTSADPDGTVAARAWDTDDDGQFDDGTGPTATRAFPAAGAFPVRLRVTDDDGASADAVRTVTVTAAPPPDAGGANLVANGSFETVLSGWGTWQATLTRETVADAPAGSWAARVTRSAGTAFTIDDAPTTVTAATGGVTYRARAMVRAATASAVGKQVVVYLRERSAAGAVLRTVAGPAVTLTTAFQPATAELVPLAAGNQIEIYAGPRTAVSGDAFLIDDISMRAG